jgi:DNA-3-methyladenine glycosylase II
MSGERELREAYERLGARDAVLADLVRRHGRPDPFVWAPVDDAATTRFAGLILHIISQQISTAVAVQLFHRVEAGAGGALDPSGVAGLGADRLRELGLSRAKAVAVVGVAERHLAGTLDTDGLAGVSDDEALAALTAARGVGPWTAQMFLIHELRRPDVLPAGDLGIRHAVAANWPRSGLPSTAEVTQRGRGWRPYRTYAAALLWTSLRPDTEDPLTGSGRH